MTSPVAIMFVDIADSTGLYERLGDLAAARIIREARGALAGACERATGRVIQHLGDGLLLTFPDATGAAQAAHDMQDIAGRVGVAVRVAAHLGPVVTRGDAIFGDTVNVAARLEALAQPGEILFSQELALALPELLREGAQHLDTVIVKGKTVPTAIWRLARHAPDETTIGRPPALRPAGAARLHLTCSGRAVTLGPARRLVIGRAADCDLVVDAPCCSRRHLTVSHRRDRFVIDDGSSNGTCLKPEGSRTIFLLRDSASLYGRGLIGLGREPEDARTGHVVAYRVEGT